MRILVASIAALALLAGVTAAYAELGFRHSECERRHHEFSTRPNTP